MCYNSEEELHDCVFLYRLNHPPSSLQKKAKEPMIPIEQEYQFVNKVERDFFCPVLYGLLLQPYLTECCGKHLSQEAANRIIEQGAICPLCKSSKLNGILDKRFQRQVRELLVFCRHRNRGCEWAAELSSFEQHIESCPKRNSPITDSPLGTVLYCSFMHLFNVTLNFV